MCEVPRPWLYSSMTIYLTLLNTLFALVTVVLAVATGAVAVYRFAYARGFAAAKDEFRASRLRDRYERLYAPMEALFLTRHVTTAHAVLAAHFTQRVGNAWKLAKGGNLLLAARALRDRCETRECAEIEYGGRFPMGRILRILAENETFADSELLQLVCSADRSRYESPTDDECGLTDEEFALFRHIAKTAEELRLLLESGEIVERLRAA